MPKPVSDVITDASRLLQDVANRRWPVATLVRAASAAQRAIVRLSPITNYSTFSMSLVAGVNQSFPIDCVRVAEFVANADGSPIRECAERSLDAFQPGWRSATANANVVHAMRVPGDDQSFRVYPPQPSGGTGTITLRYARLPADLAVGGNLALRDEYFDLIVLYTVYRALIEDSADQANQARAQTFLTDFATLLGTTTDAAAAAGGA